jgi:hypothetical protein
MPFLRAIVVRMTNCESEQQSDWCVMCVFANKNHKTQQSAIYTPQKLSAGQLIYFYGVAQWSAPELIILVFSTCFYNTKNRCARHPKPKNKCGRGSYRSNGYSIPFHSLHFTLNLCFIVTEGLLQLTDEIE